jgi:hypothetical protein
MRKKSAKNCREEPVENEKHESPFDWLLFIFLAFVIVLLMMVIAK